MLLWKNNQGRAYHQITPFSRIGTCVPRSAEVFGKEVDAADNLLSQVREHKNVIGNQRNTNKPIIEYVAANLLR